VLNALCAVCVWLLCQECHERSLRPALGHPAQQAVLLSLCGEEDARHENSMAAISAYTKAQQVAAALFIAVDVCKPALNTNVYFANYKLHFV